MRIAMLGATGRTGRLLLTDLARRGHTLAVLVRQSDRLPENLAVEAFVIGDSRRRGALDELLVGADAVVSTLGRVGPEPSLHRETANALIPAMAAGVRRFVGISAGAVRLVGDERTPWASVVTWAALAAHAGTVRDKRAEHAAWSATDLDWTLVRPLRVVDGPHVRHVEHHAHRPPSAVALTRHDLAVFMGRVVSEGLYVREAPFVAGPSPGGASGSTRG